ELTAARDALAKAAADLEGLVATMLTDLAATQQDVTTIYKVGLNATRLLLASGDVFIGYLLVKGAAIAADKLPGASAKDKSFYAGKIAAAKFFAQEVLPGVAVQRAVAESVDTSLMDLAEDAF
ncbi:acyl-CoA dehydrogenase C-terminal domain-containing protein, partial [Streptomyces sp. 2MCAF27]